MKFHAALEEVWRVAREPRRYPADAGAVKELSGAPLAEPPHCGGRARSRGCP